MRRLSVKEIYALDGKGKAIAGTIIPIHPDCWLDSEGRCLEWAEGLRLAVMPETGIPAPRNVLVKVVYTEL